MISDALEQMLESEDVRDVYVGIREQMAIYRRHPSLGWQVFRVDRWHRSVFGRMGRPDLLGYFCIDYDTTWCEPEADT